MNIVDTFFTEETTELLSVTRFHDFVGRQHFPAFPQLLGCSGFKDELIFIPNTCFPESHFHSRMRMSVDYVSKLLIIDIS